MRFSFRAALTTPRSLFSGELTDRERAVIAEGSRARYAAETVMRDLVRARLDDDSVRPGEQRALFRS
jgi:hypothetical protein